LARVTICFATGARSVDRVAGREHALILQVGARPASMPPTSLPGWMTQYRTLGRVST